MSLGLCCQLTETIIHKNGSLTHKNVFDARTLQLGRWNSGEYDEARVRATYLHNARKMIEVLPQVIALGIRHFRISSSNLPLSDKVPREWWDNSELRGIYKVMGDYCRLTGTRITVHPGQFTVLNSQSPNVVAKAVVELETAAWIFDACEFDESPQYAINIHSGARERFGELVTSTLSLPHNVRSRLTFENCESVASVEDLYNVFEATGVPITFDSHHHSFRPGTLTTRKASDLSRTTWPAHIMPVQHLSNTTLGLEASSFPDRRKHSDSFHYIPLVQLEALQSREIAVECEAKAKERALLQLASDFSIPVV